MWDRDPEVEQDVLVIDADPMRVVNDPRLNEFIARLQQDSQTHPGTGTKKESTGHKVVEFLGAVLIKFFEVLIEALA